MINRTLRYGSTGNEVTQLQQGLNLLPSKLAALKPDGVYGTKTTSRVREFQSTNKLTPDGITGPLTWKLFSDLLAKLQQGGLPVGPSPTAAAANMLRPIVLTIAQQHFGMVDFQQLHNGRPKGLDFLIEMFRFAANVTLTDHNFKDPKTQAWSAEPWISNPNEQRKSWCGVFCVYCYRKAGLNASWNLAAGKPVGPLRLNTFSQNFVANIRPADIGCVASKNHHFLIESVDGKGPVPSLTTIDGNQVWGRILRRSLSTGNAHRVGSDNFNYYSII